MIINIKKIVVLLFKSKEVLKLLIINNEIQFKKEMKSMKENTLQEEQEELVFR